MSKSIIQIKGLDKLEKKLSNISKNLKRYEGNHTITLPFTKEQWNAMTESERNLFIEQAKKKFMTNVIKDVFR